MARRVIVVCDHCEEPKALKRYRVGTIDRMYVLDLCDDCAAPLHPLIAIGAGRQSDPVRMRPSTPEELQRLKAQHRKNHR